MVRLSSAFARLRPARIVFVLGMAVALTVGGGMASAVTKPKSYVWNDYTGRVAVYGVPYYAVPKQYSRNGTRIDMYCWTDNAGQRWAYGQLYDTGTWGYVAMWEVSNQWKQAPHC